LLFKCNLYRYATGARVNPYATLKFDPVNVKSFHLNKTFKVGLYKLHPVETHSLKALGCIATLEPIK
jgi:hypothetical protein